ncbi:MAG: hypothetical protein AB1720_07675 [Pseudomonadota bacterium]
MDDPLQILEHAQKTAVDLAVQFGPKVAALRTLAAGYFAGRWIGRVADSMLTSLHLDETLRLLDVGERVACDTDLKQALAAIDDVFAAHPKVSQEPRPVIGVLALGDSSVNIAIRPWVAVAGFHQAASDLTRAALETLRARDIRVPYPQCEVRLLGNA